MTSHVDAGGLKVAAELHDFVERRALPGTGVESAAFWQGFGRLVTEFMPRNRTLVDKRQTFQKAIDDWHKAHPGQPDPEEYKAFLAQIGYLVYEGGAFKVSTKKVDDEFAKIAGPQLVVPVMNARYAINAANARWGSLYDALYGTDAMGDSPPSGGYDRARGHRVVTWAKSHLKHFMRPAVKDWNAIVGFLVENGRLMARLDNETTVEMTGEPLEGGTSRGRFAGYRGDPASPTAILLQKNNLHAELQIDREHQIGRHDKAGIADVLVEAAITTIMDCEDSVAAVDAEDKVLTYSNWLGLMRGDLTTELEKDGETVTRRMTPDRDYTAPDGSALTLPGRSLMLVRNVGPLMTNPAVLTAEGREVPEELIDGPVTTLCAMHDIAKREGPRNSRTGSVYIVKPKMHGPEEVAYTNEFMGRIEQILGLGPNTIKLGIMDEERRTTVNLKECIRAAKSRVCFINTGFLDRTGDEIHTAMHAGPMVRKTEMKSQAWIKAYEDWNVDIGLECGLKGVAQIGKGMWAMPDLMNDMLAQKIGHPMAGANTAWVPSPTAATLHATHYHQVNVAERQQEIAERERASLDDILTVPLARDTNWSPDVVQAEVDNNAQGILGYVVRWVNAGVGCSKVPDINDVALMEDRATCRISSQHIANWLMHGIVSREQVIETMKRMAKVVDRQNADDPTYQPMAPAYDGPAFEGACRLVLEGAEQPSGYTEPVLHEMRAKKKAQG